MVNKVCDHNGSRENNIAVQNREESKIDVLAEKTKNGFQKEKFPHRLANILRACLHRLFASIKIGSMHWANTWDMGDSTNLRALGNEGHIRPFGLSWIATVDIPFCNLSLTLF